MYIYIYTYKYQVRVLVQLGIRMMPLMTQKNIFEGFVAPRARPRASRNEEVRSTAEWTGEDEGSITGATPRAGWFVTMVFDQPEVGDKFHFL